MELINWLLQTDTNPSGADFENHSRGGDLSARRRRFGLLALGVAIALMIAGVGAWSFDAEFAKASNIWNLVISETNIERVDPISN